MITTDRPRSIVKSRKQRLEGVHYTTGRVRLFSVDTPDDPARVTRMDKGTINIHNLSPEEAHRVMILLASDVDLAYLARRIAAKLGYEGMDR